MTKATVLLVCLSLAGCSIIVSGRPDVCGEYPADGGPSVIVTRDQELCEVVRLRVSGGLASLPEVSQKRIDELVERTRAWESIRKMDELLQTLRDEAGEGFALDVEHAVAAVGAQSKRPLSADCESQQERCMVRGAVRGIRIALLNAQPAGELPQSKPADVY